jgi:hypothetical protein
MPMKTQILILQQVHDRVPALKEDSLANERPELVQQGERLR